MRLNEHDGVEAGWQVYWMALRRRMWLLLGLSILAGVLTLGAVGRMPDQHEVYWSYVVSLTEREQGDEFRFDGYYALQATDLFAATLARWIAAPEVVAEALDMAGVDQGVGVSRQQLDRWVAAEKTAPQLIQVTVTGESREEAQKVASALRAVLAKRVEEYHEQGIPELRFRAVATEEWSGVVKAKDYLVALAAFGLVLLVGVNVVALQVALRSSAHDESGD